MAAGVISASISAPIFQAPRAFLFRTREQGSAALLRRFAVEHALARQNEPLSGFASVRGAS
jgi:hypothetical protein